MKQQLIQYVELLFAGNPGSEDMKQEILQNTLDKYDDYIAQGKPEEAAYRLAIAGIGDISEILGSEPVSSAPEIAQQSTTDYRGRPVAPTWKKVVQAIAVFLYILCVTPVIVLSSIGMEELGVCGMFGMIAIATALMIIAGGSSGTRKQNAEQNKNSQESELDKAIGTIIGVLGLCIYLGISFWSGAWWITWLIFPIMGAIKGIISAAIDLKEAKNHEN